MNWTYLAGVDGQRTVDPMFRVRGIACHVPARGSDGSLRITGGERVPIPAGLTVNINPDERLGSPEAGSTERVVIEFEGTDMYFIELVSR